MTLAEHCTITELEPLSERQQAACLCHSIIAIHLVIEREIKSLCEHIDSGCDATKLLTLTGRYHEETIEPQTVASLQAMLAELDQELVAFFTTASGEDAVRPSAQLLLQESFRNLHQVQEELAKRVEEMVANELSWRHWQHFSHQKISNLLKQALRAMAGNSRWAYDFAFGEQAPAGDNIFHVPIQVEGGRDGHINMPSLAIDSMRDLVANARKASQPGSRISISVVDDGSYLAITVRDQGCGIIAEDLPRVVSYGERGSNATPKTLRAGGLGLTKAALLAQENGGQLKISSSDQGTVVRLEFPSRA